ncbi:unnamed protein product, partial [Ectocarpus sp. 12 AP-2014]
MWYIRPQLDVWILPRKHFSTCAQRPERFPFSHPHQNERPKLPGNIATGRLHDIAQGSRDIHPPPTHTPLGYPSQASTFSTLTAHSILQQYTRAFAGAWRKQICFQTRKNAASAKQAVTWRSPRHVRETAALFTRPTQHGVPTKRSLSPGRPSRRHQHRGS